MAIMHPHYSPTLCRNLQDAKDAAQIAFDKKDEAARLARHTYGKKHCTAMDAYVIACDAWVEARGAYFKAKRAFK